MTKYLIATVVVLLVGVGIYRAQLDDSADLTQNDTQTPSVSDIEIGTSNGSSTTVTNPTPTQPAASSTNLTKLRSKTWAWVNLKAPNGKVTTPAQPNKFSLTFNAKNEVSVSTDCNGMGGDYQVSGNSLLFGNMISTLMFCEGSQETEFAQALAGTTSFTITSNGELILSSKTGGTMTFR